MARAMEIRLVVAGLPQLNQLSQSLRQVSQTQRQLSGPAGRLQAAGGALPGGVNAADFDRQIRLMRAQTSFARAQRQLRGPSFGERFSDLVNSTRVGGSVSPLIGRMGALFGMSGGATAGVTVAIAAVVAALTAAVAAVKLFTDTVRTTVAALQEAAQARALTGGTAGNIAGLQAMGLSASQIAGVAGGLRESLAGNPLAMGQGARLGLRALPRGMGHVNEAELLQTAISRIAAMGSASERLAAAQRLNLDSMIPLIEVYRRHKGVLDADAQVRKSIADQSTLRAAEDVGVAFDRLKFNLMSLLQSLSKPFLKDIAAFFTSVATAVRDLAMQIGNNPKAVEAAFTPIINFLKTVYQMFKQSLLVEAKIKEFLKMVPAGTEDKVRQAFEHYEGVFKRSREAMNRRESVMDRHTRALETHARAMQEGLHGGGERTRGAIPASWQGYYMGRALEGAALRYGAFSL